MTLTTNGASSTLTPQEQLQARLSDPKIIEALNRLLDRAELLAFSADALDALIKRGDTITESLGGMVSEAKNAAMPPELMEVAGKLPQLARAGMQVSYAVDKPEFAALLNSGILEQLGNPSTIESLKLLLSKLDLLAFAAKALDEFLRRGDTIVDSVGESLGDLRKLTASVDFDKIRSASEQLPGLLDAGSEIVKSGVLDKLRQLAEAGATVVDSGMLDPATVKVLAENGKIAAASYVEARTAPKQEIKGIFGLIGALRDPALEPALSFFIQFMKSYSKRVK
jgi:uncharacterized protein YjgD (DUF1641 family)